MSAVDRIFVVDPVRHDRRGHHWHFAEGVLREAADKEFAVKFFVAKSAAGRTMPGPGFQPVFRHGLYRPVTGDRNESLETDYRLGSAAFRDDLLACAAFDPGPRDLILVPTASIRNVGGVAAWRAATGNRTPVAFFFHFLLPDTLRLDSGSEGRAIAREAGQALLKSESAAPFLITTANATLAHELADAMRLKVHAAPLPLWYDLAVPSARSVGLAAESASPVVAFVGELRKEKGGDLLPSIIQAVSRSDTNPHFIVQAGIAEDGLLQALAPLEKRGLASIVREILSEGAYLKLIENASIILLPYDRERYRSRTSGAFAFAVAHERPCIVPDQTWMAEKITAGYASGAIYSGDSVEKITAALAQGLKDLPTLTAAAHACAPRWQSHESGSAFIEMLLRWVADSKSV
jgi:glycosyltransferase involved in cell wall biosynthesis